MIERGFEVSIAASGSSLFLLQKEFPDLKFFPIKGYRVQYSHKKRFLPLKILLQLPKILLTIRDENRWLKKLLESETFDLIISDNRYGFYHQNVSSVFITHQLLIYSKRAWMRKWMQRINYRYINRFSFCWIPDFSGQPNLAGKLSHPIDKPEIPLYYLGPLSRFVGTKKPSLSRKKYKICFLLSGPEPQRSLLENKILKLASSLEGPLLLLRATPEAEPLFPPSPNLEIINHLSTNEMKEKILDSEFVLSRAGYTTIMELASLNVRGILIPTPGQTEQEYLAGHLMHNRWFYCFRQDQDLKQNIEKALSFRFDQIAFSNHFPQILDQFFTELPGQKPS